MHEEGKECAKTKERTQHTMRCGIGMATGDPGEMSRAKAREAVLCPVQEAGQQRRAHGVYRAGDYLGDYSGCIWGISWAGGKPVTEVQAPTVAGTQAVAVARCRQIREATRRRSW